MTPLAPSWGPHAYRDIIGHSPMNAKLATPLAGVHFRQGSVLLFSPLSYLRCSVTSGDLGSSIPKPI